jgi:hypothetical protein
MDQRERVDQLLQALQSETVEAGLLKLEHLLSLQEKVEDHVLQEGYVRGLLSLLRPGLDAASMQEIERRLRLTPAYSEHPEVIERHAATLLDLLKRTPSFVEARALAERLPGLRGYGSSLTLQTWHALALFEASQKVSARGLELAEQIARIPSFADASEIQLACARTLCNVTAGASGEKEVGIALQRLEAIASRENDPALAECWQRALRNRTRFQELRAQRQGQPAAASRVKLLAAVAAASVVLAVPLVLHQRGAAPAPASASPTPSGPSAPERDLAGYLEKTRTALGRKDYDKASIEGLVALRLAEQLDKAESKNESLDLLASAFSHLGHPEQAAPYLEQISSEVLLPLARRHLQAARKAQQGKEVVATRVEMDLFLQLLSRAKGPLDPALLGDAAAFSQGAGLPAEASKIRERLGELAQAAELAEQAGDLVRAEALLKTLVQTQPGEKPRLLEFRQRTARAELADGEAALTDNALDLAEQQATLALEQLKSLKGAAEEKARALTVLAKVAYLQERYPQALDFARRAQAAAPNADRQARLSSYRFRDSQLVTRDELDLDSFVFPQPVKSNKFYTYAYYLGTPGDFVSQGREELFQEPQARVEVRSLYGPRARRAVSCVAMTNDGRTFSFDIDAAGAGELKPGVYDSRNANDYTGNIPTVRFYGDGRGGGGARARLVVHQASWTAEGSVASFAADFLVQTSYGRDAVFGKVRYNSPFE